MEADTAKLTLQASWSNPLLSQNVHASTLIISATVTPPKSRPL